MPEFLTASTRFDKPLIVGDTTMALRIYGDVQILKPPLRRAGHTMSHRKAGSECDFKSVLHGTKPLLFGAPVNCC